MSKLKLRKKDIKKLAEAGVDASKIVVLGKASKKKRKKQKRAFRKLLGL